MNNEPSLTHIELYQQLLKSEPQLTSGRGSHYSALCAAEHRQFTSLKYKHSHQCGKFKEFRGNI